MDLAIIVAAIALGAFVKGVTGAGLPLIAIPVMTMFLGVEHAVVIMTIPGVVSNAWLVWIHRRHLPEARDLRTLVGTGIVGAAAGTWLLKSLDPRFLSLVLAALIVGYAAVFVTRPGFRLRPGLTRYLSGPVGGVAGALQGATGISGPLVSTYLHGYRFERAVYVVAGATLYLVFSVTQVFSLAGLGLYYLERVWEGLLALLPLVLIPLGNRVAGRLSRRAFEYIVLVLLLLMAAAMTYEALFGG
ncbi:MAG: TSUP family transporter [Streptosporangiales bacterium]|nr:TSUP family transporter [Streptosporangiales bacterium]